MCNVILSLISKPITCQKKTPNTAKCQKPTFKSTGSDDEDPHGYINLTEAKAHVDALEKLMTMIENEVEKQNMIELLETVLSDMKEILATLTPTMQLADTSTVS